MNVERDDQDQQTTLRGEGYDKQNNHNHKKRNES